MIADYSTTLFGQLAHPLKPRQVEKAMKALDREILNIFAFENREFAAQLLPGLTSRRFGNRFGVQPKAARLNSGYLLDWNQLLATLQRELRLKTPAEAEEVADAYVRAHVFLMTPNARLDFASLCPDDMMRSYLRALS